MDGSPPGCNRDTIMPARSALLLLTTAAARHRRSLPHPRPSPRMGSLAVFGCPARYVQGRDATKQLGEQLQKIGVEGPLMILASNVRPKPL